MTTRKDIVDSALQLENDGIDFYMKTAENANPIAKKMFESFAEDEKKHIKWIKQLASKEKIDVEEPEIVYERLRKIFRDTPEHLKENAKATEDDTQALKIAIGMETKSKEAYEKWAEEVDDKEAEDLCRVLAKYEGIHRKLFQNAEEYLNRTGDWFMKEEQWIFDGG